EYSWFGHIKQGSSRVKVGQRVKQGQIIAAMGASGSSLFPHLHYELRNGGGAREVEGLPSYFSNFRRILGSRSVNVRRGAVNTGDIVDWQSTSRVAAE
ncbi:MAG: M23 family metallopeptidase, partial [Acidobacteriota bacterium]|nr:M23 family metallopeptidase [Acidobacteriota bacterium]